MLLSIFSIYSPRRDGILILNSALGKLFISRRVPTWGEKVAFFFCLVDLLVPKCSQTCKMLQSLRADVRACHTILALRGIETQICVILHHLARKSLEPFAQTLEQ